MGFLEELGFTVSEADRPSRTYSGGMRRKLSLACTLISSPALVYFDEMTCGVDIVAQKKVWQKVQQREKDKQTIVLTTHSMVEADLLCDRIGILVNGALRCCGKSSNIKGRYGSGYQLELQVRIKVGGNTNGGNLLVNNSSSSSSSSTNADIRDDLASQAAISALESQLAGQLREACAKSKSKKLDITITPVEVAAFSETRGKIVWRL